MSGKNNKINQSSKSTSSNPPYREFPVATSTFTGLVLFIISSIFLGFLGTSNTYASSINITLSGNVSLNLLKDNNNAVFGKSTEATATVTSDHFTGYTLTIEGSNDSGKLENGDKSKFLSSIDTAISENIFKTNSDYNDHWGFLPSKYNSIDNNNYQPSPTTTGTTIDVTNTPTDSDGNIYTLALGAKVTPEMALDSYGQTFVLAATGNGYDYYIGFTDDLAELPDDMYGSSISSNTVTLPTTAPTKAGYIFKGWCDQKTTNNGTTCPGTTYPANQVNTITLNGGSANHYDLHTIWEPITFDKAFQTAGASRVGNYYRMQDMTTSICNSVAIGQEGTLVDNRSGNKTYNVGKMKDGKCWTLDNLALGGSSAISLTPNDTNITASWTLPASVTSFDGSTGYINARINTASIDIMPDDMSRDHNWKIGAYYNYCAASAGTYCLEKDTVDTMPVSRDICPKGWRMPSDGPGGEYQDIYNAYGDNYTDFRIALHLPLSGYYSAQASIQGGGGLWWSSVFYDVDGVYLLSSYELIYPQLSNVRWRGFSMRCVAK